MMTCTGLRWEVVSSLVVVDLSSVGYWRAILFWPVFSLRRRVFWYIWRILNMIIVIYRALIFCRFGLGLSPQALWCRSRSDDDPKSEPHFPHWYLHGSSVLTVIFAMEALVVTFLIFEVVIDFQHQNVEPSKVRSKWRLEWIKFVKFSRNCSHISVKTIVAD